MRPGPKAQNIAGVAGCGGSSNVSEAAYCFLWVLAARPRRAVGHWKDG